VKSLDKEKAERVETGVKNEAFGVGSGKSVQKDEKIGKNTQNQADVVNNVDGDQGNSNTSLSATLQDRFFKLMG
jgi:hypothetical protein